MLCDVMPNVPLLADRGKHMLPPKYVHAAVQSASCRTDRYAAFLASAAEGDCGDKG